MDNRKFESLILRLETTATSHPQRYLIAVLAVALLGFTVLGFAILCAMIPIAVLAGLVFIVITTGGKALIILLKLGKLLILLMLPAWMMVKTSFQLLFSRFPQPEGRELLPSEAPVLFEHIKALRQQMNGPQIHHVLVTDQLNAAIIQYPRLGLFGWEHNYLILGLPLLQTMSEQEALAVVAHEYGHLSGHHSRLGGFIYRLRSAWGRMQSLSEQWQDWGSRLIARMFRWYAPYFNAYTFVFARQNEYVADRISAEIAGANNAANALMRVNIIAQFENEQFWPSINRLVASTPDPLADKSMRWTESIHSQLDAGSRQRYLDVANQRKTDHLDTHPALSDRLQAIGITPNSNAAQLLSPPPENAAQRWLGEKLQTIQAKFDQDWQKSVAQQWKERHQYLHNRQQRLQELQAKSEPNTEEHWELINIIGELAPEEDLLTLINQLLEKSPDYLPALFRRGTLLLNKNDEAGVTDLEHVMMHDAQSIMPGCELLWRFYHENHPEKAEHYRARWQERANFETEVHTEAESLPATALLTKHELSFETEEQIRHILLANGKHIRCAYLLQRVFKTDPTLHDYVIAFETSFLTLGDKGRKIIQQLTKQEYPVSLFIVHLGKEPYKKFRRQIKRLGISPLIGK